MSSKQKEKSIDNYWVLDLQFARLAISQETPTIESDIKVNGKMLKKLAGGNDVQIARRNFDRVDSHFKIDTTFLIMGNNALVIEPADTFEHCIPFNSTNQFKTQEEVDKMIADGEPELLWGSYKIKDFGIKDKCQTNEWMNAMVYLLYQNFKNVPVSVHNDCLEENEESLRKQILKNFKITKDGNDVVLCSDIAKWIDCGDKKKISNELISMGVIKKKATGGTFRNKFCYYGLIGNVIVKNDVTSNGMVYFKEDENNSWLNLFCRFYFLLIVCINAPNAPNVLA